MGIQLKAKQTRLEENNKGEFQTIRTFYRFHPFFCNAFEIFTRFGTFIIYDGTSFRYKSYTADFRVDASKAARILERAIGAISNLTS